MGANESESRKPLTSFGTNDPWKNWQSTAEDSTHEYATEKLDKAQGKLDEVEMQTRFVINESGAVASPTAV